MTAPNVNPDPGLYDEAEWEMLAAMENEDPRPPAGADVREARRLRWRQAFRDAAPGGCVGPVAYDIPYPWRQEPATSGDRTGSTRYNAATPEGEASIMDNQRTATIHFDVQVEMERRDQNWAAYIEPPGTTVYGDTEADARARVAEAVDFFAAGLLKEIGLERFRRYLDGHGVKSVVVDPDSDDRPRPGKMPPETISVSFPVETDR